MPSLKEVNTVIKLVTAYELLVASVSEWLVWCGSDTGTVECSYATSNGTNLLLATNIMKMFYPCNSGKKEHIICWWNEGSRKSWKKLWIKNMWHK